VYQPWTGDGSIVANVESVTNTHAWAKAGVMFRSTLDANAPHAFMLVSAASGTSFIRRTSAGGTSVSNTDSTLTAPRWVRLVRSGNTFTAYQSSDGTSWILAGTATITMPQTIYVGLALTSHNNTTLTTGVFGSVTVSSP
jgi:regulation of enolase protein 1 (concanavalin A-like superfamily)